MKPCVVLLFLAFICYLSVNITGEIPNYTDTRFDSHASSLEHEIRKFLTDITLLTELYRLRLFFLLEENTNRFVSDSNLTTFRKKRYLAIFGIPIVEDQPGNNNQKRKRIPDRRGRKQGRAYGQIN